jgi:hypothetical protein
MVGNLPCSAGFLSTGFWSAVGPPETLDGSFPQLQEVFRQLIRYVIPWDPGSLSPA